MILMRAVEKIHFRNLRAFEKEVLKEGFSSSFHAEAGENIEEVMKRNGYTDEEVSRTKTRILKGNPHWVKEENEKEEKEVKSVRFEKEMEDKEKEELERLNKKQQIKMLEELGAKTIPLSETERVQLIMRLRRL